MALFNMGNTHKDAKYNDVNYYSRLNIKNTFYTLYNSKLSWHLCLKRNSY